jgi:hypothetical protein
VSHSDKTNYMKKLIVLITLALASLASAGDRYTFTNQFGGITGYAQPNFNGGYTFTNQFGGGDRLRSSEL